MILGVEMGEEEYVGEGGAVDEGELGRDFLTRWWMKSSSIWSWEEVRDMGLERLL